MARTLHTIYHEERKLRVVFLEDVKDRVFFQQEKLIRLKDAKGVIPIREEIPGQEEGSMLRNAELWFSAGSGSEDTFSSLEAAMERARATIGWLDDGEGEKGK